MIDPIRLSTSALLAALACGCATGLPKEPPPLASMEEPSAYLAWPDDEEARRELPLGGFSGIVAADARMSLEDLVSGQTSGLRVGRVVENSPADAAGIAVDDLLVEAGLAGEAPHALGYVADWRALELAGGAGTKLEVLVDRAGARRVIALELEDRVRPADAPAERRAREEDKVGVVVRSATSVEARRVGLPPGAGAVVVGLALESPCRAVGIGFGDLISHADGERLGEPEALVRAIDDAEDEVVLDVWRDGVRRRVRVPMSSRAQELQRFKIPILISYESDRGRTGLEIAMSLIDWESTDAAWELTLGWFLLTLSGGDSERLQEVDA